MMKAQLAATLVMSAIALCSCVSTPPKQKVRVDLPVEELHDYGAGYCLGDVDHARGKIIEVPIDQWQAYETVGTPGSCDIGPLDIDLGSPSCQPQPPLPPLEILNLYDRIELKRRQSTDFFDVVVKRNNGDVDKAFSSFVLYAEKNPANQNVVWLRNSSVLPVIWVHNGVTYSFDVFIYFSDMQGLNKQKIYRVEFFDRTKRACVLQEPSNAGMLNLPDSTGGCDQPAEAPIGEGRQRKRISMDCNYTP